jgi:AcrR family transcriptional regulator
VAKRAYGVEDKQLRRAHILATARELFAAGTGDLPAVADIAAAAGLAKGTVYLYFETREAIFADLLLDGWAAVLRELDASFGSGISRTDKVPTFLSRVVTYMDRHPELLRLDALGYGVVERNLKPEALRLFKSTLTERLLRSGVVVERALDLPAGRGIQLLMRTYALTRGLWQSISGDVQGHGTIDGVQLKTKFRQELAEALAEYWRGALGSRDAVQLGRLARPDRHKVSRRPHSRQKIHREPPPPSRRRGPRSG